MSRHIAANDPNLGAALLPVRRPRRGATTYLFEVRLAREADGRWSAVCPAFPGCATWAHSKQFAVRSIQEAIELRVRDKIAAGTGLPRDTKTIGGAWVGVTV